MENAWFFGAGFGLLGICGIHLVLGGRDVARPLFAADLDPMVKWTQYYCWHVVTLTLAGLGLALIGGGLVPGLAAAAGFAALMAVAFGVYGVIVPRRAGLSYGVLPQGLLLLPVGLVGCLGIWLG